MKNKEYFNNSKNLIITFSEKTIQEKQIRFYKKSSRIQNLII